MKEEFRIENRKETIITDRNIECQTERHKLKRKEREIIRKRRRSG